MSLESFILQYVSKRGVQWQSFRLHKEGYVQDFKYLYDVAVVCGMDRIPISTGLTIMYHYKIMQDDPEYHAICYNLA